MAKHMEKTKRAILVSGMSGAGKSTATRILEDMGYHIIDNFPVQLLSLLVDMIETSTDPRYSYIALSTSAQDFALFLSGLKGEGIEVQVMFLDANDSVLLHRTAAGTSPAWSTLCIHTEGAPRTQAPPATAFK